MADAIRNLGFAQPNQSDTKLLHRTKYFENTDPEILRTEINNYISNILMLPVEQKFYINSMRFGTYVTDPPMPETRHY